MPWYWSDDVARFLLGAGKIDTTVADQWLGNRSHTVGLRLIWRQRRWRCKTTTRSR